MANKDAVDADVAMVQGEKMRSDALAEQGLSEYGYSTS